MKGRIIANAPTPDTSGVAGRRAIKTSFLVLYFFLSIFTMLNFLQVSLLGDHYFGNGSRVSFEGLYNGTSWRPFVYRILVPKLTRVVTTITPTAIVESVNKALYNASDSPLFVAAKTAMPWTMELFPDQETIYPRIICILIIYGCLIGYISVLQKISRTLFPKREFIALIAPVLAFSSIMLLSKPMQYPYDIAVLFLSSICYYCLLTQNFRHYFIWFFLACLNKETSAFIVLFFVFWFFGRMGWRTYFKYIIIQAAILGTTKGIITYTYRANGGLFLERHMERVMNYEWYQFHTIHHIVLITAFVYFLLHSWKEKPDFLKCSIMLIPYAITAYVLFGAPGEYRVFFDILPLIILLISHSLVELSMEPKRYWLLLRAKNKG